MNNIPPQVPPVLAQPPIPGADRRQIRAELAAIEAELNQYEQNIAGMDERVRNWLGRFKAAIARQENVQPLIQEFGRELRILLNSPITQNIVGDLLRWLREQNQPQAPAEDDDLAALVAEIEAGQNADAPIEALAQEIMIEAEENFEQERNRAEAFFEQAGDEIQAMRQDDNQRRRKLLARIDRLLNGPNPQVQALQQQVLGELLGGIQGLQQRVNNLQAQNARLGAELADVNRRNVQLDTRINEANRKLQDKEGSFLDELVKGVALIAVCIVFNEVMGGSLLPVLSSILFA